MRPENSLNRLPKDLAAGAGQPGEGLPEGLSFGPCSPTEDDPPEHRSATTASRIGLLSWDTRSGRGRASSLRKLERLPRKRSLEVEGAGSEREPLRWGPGRASACSLLWTLSRGPAAPVTSVSPRLGVRGRDLGDPSPWALECPFLRASLVRTSPGPAPQALERLWGGPAIIPRSSAPPRLSQPGIPRLKDVASTALAPGVPPDHGSARPEAQARPQGLARRRTSRRCRGPTAGGSAERPGRFRGRAVPPPQSRRRQWSLRRRAATKGAEPRSHSRVDRSQRRQPR